MEVWGKEARDHTNQILEEEAQNNQQSGWNLVTDSKK
jgi:hypothetical protein